MSEDFIVRNCAPTLARLKTGSIFSCPYQNKEQLYKSIRELNRKLSPKGVRLLPLRLSEKRALIYLYRPSNLSADLADSTAASLLIREGYQLTGCSGCIVQLIRRLRTREDFPHEIGLFLGYPPEDVQGFMDHGPQCCKCTGCWKVYGNEASAQKRFALYKKCTRIYCQQLEKGTGIERLTVAG